MNREIPVLLLTGYLGSGKTTLVNRILSNKKGIKFAVIVNDIGEVNIDADLIERGGVVGKKDESLVALQNGCICCTLKMDLVEQLEEITNMNRFDYIVIEASGICEPAPIAQTITSMPALKPLSETTPRLDCIVTVVDALRLQSEFSCGDTLALKNFEEDDIEKLLVEQIEFCNKIIINKVSEVSKDELGRIKAIIRALQPKAEIIESDFCDVDLDRLINTNVFDFDKVATSAAWIDAIENGDEHEEEHHHGHHHDEHEHHHDEHGHHHEHEEGCECHDHEEDENHHCTCHHHHHHHEGGEVEEYGIGTFVYYRRPAFDINKFDNFVAKHWPKTVIRAKGICYFSDDRDKCYLFEQAGVQKTIKDAGLWFATMPDEQLEVLMERDAKLQKDWDEQYGDRMQKIVFIGQKMDKEAIIEALDKCLED